MSIFASFVSEVLTVPGTEHAITIRKLSPSMLAEAAKAKQLASVADARAMRDAMGADLMESIAKVTPAQIKDAKAADPLLSYDRVTLMRHGITAWTYADPVDAAHIGDIDEDAQDWIAGAILKLSRPSLYQTEPEQEAAQKND